MSGLDRTSVEQQEDTWKAIFAETLANFLGVDLSKVTILGFSFSDGRRIRRALSTEVTAEYEVTLPIECPEVENGVCDTCSSADKCTGVTCNANFFDQDNDATTGCEVGCGDVADATCTSCTGTDASECQEVSCDSGFLDTGLLFPNFPN